jgi:hypothetical protein
VNALLQATWLALPVVFGGLTHVLVLQRNWFASLARAPVDGGLKVRGRRLFGCNKTWRGVATMCGATVVWTAVFDALETQLFPDLGLRVVEPTVLGSTALGLLLGSGYVLGELPNSFVKRQLDIFPGMAAPGRWANLSWLIDQVDSALGVLILLSFVAAPGIAVWAAVLGLTVFVHPAVSALMVLLGIKSRVG